MAHRWTSLTNLPALQSGSVAFIPDVMLLLTDGSVLVHQRMNEHLTPPTGMEWFRLTPDASGNYAAGTWSGPFSMSAAREYFSSGVLRDGRVFVMGGEYSTAEPPDASGNTQDTATGEVFDPVTNTWSAMNKPAAFFWVRRDAPACILADGRVLFGAAWSSRTAIWDPDTDDWREAGLAFGAAITPTKNGNGDEETWTLLPDGTVLTVNIDQVGTTGNVTAVPATEKYLPAADKWVTAGTTPSDLSFRHGYTDPATGLATGDIFEIGPALLLPNGKLFAIGATGHTALYAAASDPTQPGTWSAGPDLPLDGSGNLQLAPDTPAVLLPSGHVLLLGGAAHVTYKRDSSGTPIAIDQFSISPQVAFLYDSINSATPTTLAPQPSSSTDRGKLLLLPTGEVLYSCEQDNVLLLLTLDSSLLGPPDPSWKPVITDCPSRLVTGRTYLISGQQLNGLSQACSFGDDAQMATNYPIVRLTDPANHVVYARTLGFSTLAVATGTSTVSTLAQVPTGTPPGPYTLHAIANGIASDPVNVIVAKQDCFILLDRSTYAQGEIQAMINAAGAPAVIDPSVYVVVEGFTPTELGLNSGNLHNPPHQPSIKDPVSGVHFAFSGPVVPEDPGLPNSPQRFTFPFKASFDNGTTIFNLSMSSEPFTITATLTASGNAVSSSANIELTQNPNPFILHGDVTNGYPWYLSVDIKTLQVKAGDKRFNTPVPNTGNRRLDATGWIQQIITAFNADRATGGSLFDTLTLDEDPTTITLAETALDNTPVFNFALARVRYRDTIPASNVRCFFRMWPAQQTNATYGSPTTLYRSSPNPAAQTIPLLGIDGDEIMTIPFFATPRVHTESTDSMRTQTDSPNVQSTINASALGGEVDSFFGAWLDINQPAEQLFPVRMVGGAPSNIPDGPYSGMGQLLSIQELVRSEHQCLLAEVSFDLDPIPGSADPSNSDKLAQRNLTFGPAPNPGLSGSRRVPQTFEVRPTPFYFPSDFQPDELMIDWGGVPHGSRAQIYVPATKADEILALAAKMYSTHRLMKADASTIECPTGGVTFVPIPKGLAPNFPALLSISLPEGIKKGQVYDVTVKQVTTGLGRRPGGGGRGTDAGVLAGASAPSNTTIGASTKTNQQTVTEYRWRRVLGVFQLRIPVSTQAVLLPFDERRLSIMRSIGKSIPTDNRWYLVFQRYLDQLAGRVKQMGGDPDKVIPDPNGDWNGRIRGSRDGHSEEIVRVVGKVGGLLYGHFGTFDGFVIESEDGERRFKSHERDIESIVRDAWIDRTMVAVYTERHSSERVESILLIEPPDRRR
jgi:hypothetical protein